MVELIFFLVFTLRLSFWQRPPHCVYACAHLDLTVARRALARVLSCISNHPKILRLQRELREDAEDWLCSTGLPESGALLDFVGELRVCYTSERCIEGEHAKVMGPKNK